MAAWITVSVTNKYVFNDCKCCWVVEQNPKTTRDRKYAT